VEHGERVMVQLAEYYLAKHTEPKVDYLEKYRRLAEELDGVGVEVTTIGEVATDASLPCSEDAAKPQESLSDAPPRCPKCGSVMLKRTALKGANAGKEFWGCPGFPNCKGVVGIK
jgi:restriction system protein